MDIAIIGAGPAGLYAASLLAKAGHKVTVYEEHATIGKPIQCTGLVTDVIFDYLPDLRRTKAIINVISKIRVHTRSQSLCVGADEYVLDRTLYDQYIGRLAHKAGAKILTNHRFMGWVQGKCHIKTKEKTITISPDILIGADGPASKVSRTFFAHNHLACYKGVQIVARQSTNAAIYDTYVGDDVPRFFGWYVPESNTHVRVGLATKKHTEQYFTSLLKRLKITTNDIISKQAGLIPVFNPKLQWYKKKQAMRIYLLGDAAGQIKSTTGGGLIPQLRCTHRLVNAIEQEMGYAPHPVADRELYAHLIVRHTLDRFHESQYNQLINHFNKPRLKNTLAQISRDNSVLLMLTMLCKDPTLLRYSPRFAKELWMLRSKSL